MGKIVFLDIDGTLALPGSNTPPQSALEAVRAAQKNGNKVLLCTGRNVSMASPILKYGFDGAVCSSGGYVFVYDENGRDNGEDSRIAKVLFDSPMPEEDFRLAMQLLGEAGVYRTIEALDATYWDAGLDVFLSSRSAINSELERWRHALLNSFDIRPMAEYDGRCIYKIVFLCLQEEQLNGIRNALGDRYSFVMQSVASHGCINGEIMRRTYDKGRGVRLVAEYFGAPMSDTIGFGDSMNDLEMILSVGTSVCMKGGSPYLKERSDLICPPVDEDGISKMFTRLGLV